MHTFILLQTFVALAAAMRGPYRHGAFHQHISPRATGTGDEAPASCPSPGQLLCNGPYRFGLCNTAKTIQWQDVSLGTLCSCMGSSDNCMIHAASIGGSCVPGSDQHSSAETSPTPITIEPVPSMTTSTSISGAPSSASASAPATSQAGSPSGTSPGITPQVSGGPKYTQFNGDGSAGAGWPAMDDWLTFDQLWEANQDIIKTGCAAFEAEKNTPEDIESMRKALLAKSTEAVMSPVFTLAIMMQESLGCARVQTTEYSHKNPGLFQSFQGTGTCFGMKQCPPDAISQMVQDGVLGTDAGPGLKQNYDELTSTEAQKYYQAARVYNSGSIPESGDLGELGSTACYCSDIANRLIGWTVGTSKCTLGE